MDTDKTQSACNKKIRRNGQANKLIGWWNDHSEYKEIKKEKSK